MSTVHKLHFREVTSTNDVAKVVLRDMDSVVVIADHQTTGRGRRGREWHDAPGQSVLISFGQRHNVERSAVDLAADMARGSLAILQMLRGYGLDEVIRCKYPNDIQGRDESGWSKLAGVLVEHEFLGSMCHSTVIGIGMNVLQECFPETIGQLTTSLRRLGSDRSPSEIVADLIPEIDRMQMTDSYHVFDMWREELLKRRLTIRIEGSEGLWQAVDLDDSGRLVVMNNNDETQRIIDNGDSIRYVD